MIEKARKKFGYIAYNERKGELESIDRMNELFREVIINGVNVTNSDITLMSEIINEQIANYARVRDYASVQRMLDEGIGPTPYLKRVLIYAAQDRNVDIVKNVVTRMIESKNPCFKPTIDQMFIWCARHSAAELLTFLISVEAEAKQSLSTYFSYKEAITAAIEDDSVETIRIILSTPSAAFLAHYPQHITASHSFEPFEKAPIECACNRNDFELVKLIHKRAEVDIVFLGEGEAPIPLTLYSHAMDHDLNAILTAVRSRNVEIVQYMIDTLFFRVEALETIYTSVVFNSADADKESMTTLASFLRNYIDSGDYKKKDVGKFRKMPKRINLTIYERIARLFGF